MAESYMGLANNLIEEMPKFEVNLKAEAYLTEVAEDFLKSMFGA